MSVAQRKTKIPSRSQLLEDVRDVVSNFQNNQYQQKIRIDMIEALLYILAEEKLGVTQEELRKMLMDYIAKKQAEQNAAATEPEVSVEAVEVEETVEGQ